jgi:hypothetical protein
MTNKPRETVRLLAKPKPGDFPIGSTESRAAARMLAENQRDERERVEIAWSFGGPLRNERPDAHHTGRKGPMLAPG